MTILELFFEFIKFLEQILLVPRDGPYFPISFVIDQL